MSPLADKHVKWGIPVNIFTGQPFTENQQLRWDRLRVACSALFEVLHEIEGTDKESEGYQTRRIAIAGTHLEELQLMALREILDQ